MKKKFYFIPLLLCLSFLMFGQNNDQDLVDRQERLQKRAMLVLGTWGLANTLSGGIGNFNSHGTTKYFHQMNLSWGMINAGIAGIGYFGATRLNLEDPILINLFDKNVSLSKTLLFNAGLDVGYMGLGLYLRERSKNIANNPERIRGFGNSIILQGAFLFVFDLSVHAFNHRFSRVIKNQILELGATENGIGLSLTF